MLHGGPPDGRGARKNPFTLPQFPTLIKFSSSPRSNSSYFSLPLKTPLLPRARLCERRKTSRKKGDTGIFWRAVFSLCTRMQGGQIRNKNILDIPGYFSIFEME